nr:MAG TPA: hypothetical protein [Caudoviricetes sp.]
MRAIRGYKYITYHIRIKNVAPSQLPRPGVPTPT